MERPYPVVEFETEVQADGCITLPAALARKFSSGARVTLRIIQGTISPLLRLRRVTEDEVERIALTQLEGRENVIRFLEAEGTLASDRPFLRRARNRRRS